MLVSIRIKRALNHIPEEWMPLLKVGIITKQQPPKSFLKSYLF